MEHDIPTDSGLEHEPQYRSGGYSPDPTEPRAEELLSREAREGGREALEALHSIREEAHDACVSEEGLARHPSYDRPAHCARCGALRTGESRAAPCSACGYVVPARWSEWYARMCREVSVATTWWVILLVALTSGPLAIVVALFSVDARGLMAFVIVGPLVEELMKLGLVTYLLETRPYLLRSDAQIRGVALTSALAFAAVENWIYLDLRLPDPSDALIRWRWIVCTLLHVGATQVAAQGLVRVRRRIEATGEPPDLKFAFPWLVAAVVLHGGYNAAVGLAEISGHGF